MCTMINKKHRCSSTPKPHTMHEHSPIISKTKPKIRIIHIFEPKIIKTDVANFRELVQRLTGKPTEKRKLKAIQESHKRSRLSLAGSEAREKIKDEDEIWVGANSGGGFLGGFGDLDGFMHKFSHHNHALAPVLTSLDSSATLEFSCEER